MSTPDAEPVEKPRRSRWIWVSALLALVCVGLVVWALSARSDNQDVDGLSDELGATQDDLAAVEQDLEQANAQADKADDVEDQATAVRERLRGITSECKTALAGGTP